MSRTKSPKLKRVTNSSRVAGENQSQVDLLAAIREMSRAEARLNDGDTGQALVFERAALKALQRAFDRRRYLLRTLPERTRIDLGTATDGRREGGARRAAADVPGSNQTPLWRLRVKFFWRWATASAVHRCAASRHGRAVAVRRSGLSRASAGCREGRNGARRPGRVSGSARGAATVDWPSSARGLARRRAGSIVRRSPPQAGSPMRRKEGGDDA